MCSTHLRACIPRNLGVSLGFVFRVSVFLGGIVGDLTRSKRAELVVIEIVDRNKSRLINICFDVIY